MAEATILRRDNKAIATTAVGEVERKLTVWELLWNDGFVRKGVIILFLAAVWEAYGVLLDNPLLFPTFHDTVVTMWDKTRDGTIPMRAWASLKVLFMGYAAGIVLGARVPIILTSRADSVTARLASCAVAVLVAKARRESVKSVG